MLRITESQLQSQCIQWCEIVKGRFPGLELIFHIPNGGSRHKLEAINLKRQGVKSGVPDLFLPVAKNGYNGLFIEMKRDNKQKVSKSQQTWLLALDKMGYETCIVSSFEEFQEVIKKYYKGE